MPKAELLERDNLVDWMEEVNRTLGNTLLFFTYPDADGNAFDTPFFRLEPLECVAYEMLTVSRHTADDAQDGDTASRNLIGGAQMTRAGVGSLFTLVSGSTGSLHADTNMLSLDAYSDALDAGIGIQYDDSGGTTDTDNNMPGVWSIVMNIPAEQRGGARFPLSFVERTVTTDSYTIDPATHMVVDPQTGYLWVTNQTDGEVHVVNPDTMTNIETIDLGENAPPRIIDWQPPFLYKDILTGLEFVPARMWVGINGTPGSLGYTGWTIQTDTRVATTHNVSGSVTWFPSQVLMEWRDLRSGLITSGSEPLMLLGSTNGITKAWGIMDVTDIDLIPGGGFVTRTGWVSDWVSGDENIWVVDWPGVVYRIGGDETYPVLESRDIFTNSLTKYMLYDRIEKALYVTGNVGSGQNIYKLDPISLETLWVKDLGGGTWSVRLHEGYDVLWALEDLNPAVLHQISRDDGSTIVKVTTDVDMGGHTEMIPYPYSPYVFVSNGSSGDVIKVPVGESN